MPPDRPHRPRRTAALVLLLLVPCSLLLASCGDDAETTGAGSTTSNEPGGALSVSVEPPEATPGDNVEASVVNETEDEFTYGADYQLDRVSSDGSAEKVRLPNRAIPLVGYIAAPGKSGPAVGVKIPADLPPGTYRIVIQRKVPGVGDLSGELQVLDG